MISDRIRRLMTRRKDYQQCFQHPDAKTLTPSGRAVLEDLARYSGMYSKNTPRSATGSLDPLAMAMQEGRRQMYLRLLAILGQNEADILKSDDP